LADENRNFVGGKGKIRKYFRRSSLKIISEIHVGVKSETEGRCIIASGDGRLCIPSSIEGKNWPTALGYNVPQYKLAQAI